MAYRTCCLLAEIFLLMLLLYTVCSNGEYGYFNRTSKVTIPDVTLTLGQGSWIQVVFRTCAPSGEILKYQKNGKDLLSVSMHNTSLELSWSLNSTGSVVSLGSNFNNNTWHQFDIKFFLGVVYFNVSKPGGDALFSEVLANRTFQSFLLDVRLTHVVMELGRGFTGCLWEGPGVDFSAAGAVSSGVLWSQCPLTSQIGCSPIDSDVDDCLQIPCQHGGTCVDGFKNYTCLCKRNFNGTNCENDLRYLGCVTNPCLNNGTCTDTRTSSASYICSCIPGFTGLDCEVEIDECRSNPCRQGKCINLINAYQCDCTGTGYNGPICDNDIDECVSSPCGQGTCHNSPGSFTCTCPPGYAGLCQEGVDECVSSPCQNLGTCHDLVDGYNCTCRTGFTGTNCERNIDDCVGQTCPGNHTRCEDLINGFQCVCQYGYTGTAPSCVDIDECQSNPCINNGTCKNGENYFECSCVTGFNGTFCENNIDDCASNPCKNNATCSDKVNSFSCLCPAGFTGQTCSVNINDCANVTCQNSGSCTDLVADYRCDCTAGWTGRHCETDINECESHPCLNGATCNNLHNSFTCSCSPGYDGDVCEHNIDDCNPHPCHNNASCIDRVNDFFCNCSAEWMGKTCEQVFNACTYYTPCKNNASCLSQPPSRDYTCTCAAGFEGKNCSVNIDDCVGVTCESFQVCKDHINSYTCDCPAGWTGSRCETDIDECAGQPCLNGGTCINGTGFYTCQCHTSLMNLTRFLDGQEVTFYTGWEGSNCEKDINECLEPMVCLGNGECRNRNGSYECLCGRRNGILTTGNNCELTTSYCQHEFGLLKEPACGNGGTCIDMISGFRCICAPGFTGSRCKINIDECESSPCQHGGSCDDGINGYNCSCIPGITGSNCETNIDECASHPCLNNGVCTDFINRYTCNCSDTGFKGLTCGENIDDCISSPCQHGGSCQDGIKKYTCNCYAGYTGINCETDINECNSYPCQNSGTCLQKSNLTLYNTHYPGFVDFSYSTAAGYVCKCVLGFNGKNCENNIDDCENNTCQNGATCRDGINMYTCDCAPGYKGEKCATEIDECEIQPCKNGASCTDLIADYRCSCLPFVRGSKNYGGKNCTVILTGCDHGNRCQNDAKCVPFLQDELLNIHNYTCKCQNGWTGHFCSISTTITFAHGSHVSKIGLGDIDISLRFRTTLTEAVIVFVRVKLSEFVAMEIHDGRLQLMHGNSTHIFKQESVQSRLRVVDADWHLVHLTVKNNLTLALESSLCTFPEQCTISMVNELQPVTVESKLFIGNTDTTTSLQATVSKTAYTGCLEDVVLNNNYIIPSNQDVVFTNVSSGCPRTVQCDPYTCSRHGNCIDLWNQFKCDCHRPFLGTQCKKEYTAATFAKANISSWASFIIPAAERPELEISLKMSLFVLTRQSDGIIMYLGNSNRNNLTFIILQVASGKLAVEIYLCGSQEVIETTIDYTDGRKHFLSLELVHNTVSFLVDESIIENKTLNQPSCNLKGEFVYFGGRLPDLANRRRRKRAAIPDFSNRPNFQGVVQDPELNGKKLQFFQVVPAIDKTINMTNSSNIAEGAKSTLSACQSNPCQQNGTCQDKFYNDFICLCPYGFRGKTCSELDFCQRIQCPGTGTTCKSLADGYECIIDSTFNGANSLATYKASISSSLKISEISFKLRTTIMFGTILYLSKDDVFLKLRIANKKLELNYKTSPGMSASVYLHHELNDGKKYTINMIFNTNIVLQILFSDKIIEERKFDSELATTLKSLIHNDPVITVGGVAVGALWEKSFKGCLEEVRIGGILLPFFYNSQFENFTNTNTFNATSLTALTDGCMNTGACVGHACKNRAVCTPKWYSYTCDCGSGFAGQFCEARDRCVGVDCQNGGTCLQHLGQCRCRTGYSGNRCETAEGCTSSSCLHNGSCVNMSEGFKCQCTEEFTGQKCETSIKQNCSSSLCNNGSCTDITVNITGTEIQSFNCTCFPGYTGSLCDIEIDYCDSSPCQNGGNCTSSNGTYTCSCKDGFNGTNCENSIVCSNLQPCQNDGTCFGKEDGGWICNCTGGWGGDNCTVNHNVCNESQPCQHGKCSDSTSDYFCNCTGTGYSGTHCESDVDECSLPNPPCQNKATCNNTEGNYTCNCNTGYSGHNCDIPSCNHTECQNNSTCQTNQTRWECNCLQYYEGETCEIAGPCLNNSCSEGGMLRCEQNITENTYRCICKKGWEGQSCGRDINECKNVSLCLNGGTCRNFDGGYSCSCRPGFTGLHCETNINECENHPCKNGGHCIDNINNYTCICTKNFKGRNCTDDVDECTSQLHSCNDSEKCMNTNGSFYCQCKESFINHSGVCIEDPCLKATCENGGTCNRTSGENGGLVYVCTCLDGYEGSHCEKKMQTEELNMWYIIGPIVAIVLIIIIIVVIVFLMVARTKRATRGTYSPSRQETSGSRVELGNVLKKPPEERLI